MIRTIFSLGLLQLLLLTSLHAQQLTLSPYSRYAIGEIFQNASARHTGMGGVGIAADNYFSINRTNPAAMGDIIFTTMDVSAFGQYSRFNSASSTEDQVTAGFQNLSFAFPSNNGMVFSFGFSPYSAVGYEIRDFQQINIADSTYVQNSQYAGEGGTNQVFLGFAGRILDNRLRLGITGQYIFGGIRQEWLATIRQSDSVTTTPFQVVAAAEDRYLRGTNIQAGFIYQDTLNRDKNILWRVGGTFDYNFGLKEDQITTFTNTVIEDTIITRTFPERDIQLPFKYGVGVALHKPGYWSFAADFTMQDWNTFEQYTNDGNFGRETRISVGGEVIPKFDSFRYIERISYRFGGYYKQSYITNFGDTPVNDYGFTFGFGLPSSRKGNSRLNQGRATSRVNLSFALGRRGNLALNQPVEELYARFTLGVALNDRWFIRRVVD
ncbi:MAG: hypothetical protein AAF927_30505 [Bacteroidota bacterium]